MATVNVDKLGLAIITKDELGVGNLIFETPEYIPGIQSFQAKVKTNTGEHYEEGKLTDQDTTLQNIEISFDLGHVDNVKMAKYFGNHVASTGGVYALADDVAPYVAILTKYTLASGKGYGYKIYYKGKLSPVDETYKQTEGKVDYQDTTISCTFQPLNNNKMWKYGIETIDANCPSDIDTKFFESVIVPTSEPITELSISSSTPADEATGVIATTKPSITFNNAIATDNIMLFDSSDNSIVSTTKAYDTTGKILTITPSANLTTGKTYAIIVNGVKDIYGQTLANSIINFTVA